jgi:sugar lactone lactonase YvrE
MGKPMTAATTTSDARLAWPVAAQLGEGPLWHGDALWFCDIEGRALHRYAPATDARDTFAMPGRPSFVVPAADGGLLAGIDATLRRVGLDGRPGAVVAEIGGPPNCRTNDAVVDPRGRLWFGTMDLAQRAPIGQVHVHDARGLRAVGGHAPITNGPAVSPDGTRLYHVDTLAGIVWAFDIGARETLEDGTVFARIARADGSPDGVTVDAEGCVWVALWGGWSVRRYSPAGELLARVALPCAQVTKIAFGGADLRTAYVTSARTGLDDDALRAQPDAGGLFAFTAPAPGLPAVAAHLP